LLNQKNYILKAKGITTVAIYEIKENIRLKIWNYRELPFCGRSRALLEVTVGRNSTA